MHIQTKKHKIILAVGLIVIIALSFYGGVAYQTSKIPAGGQFGQAGQGGFGGAGGRTGGARGGAGGGMVSGSVLSINGNTMTVDMRAGGSKVVILPGSASILKSTTGTTTDLVAGENVIVNGTTNTDGSVTATMVQIRNTPAGAPSQK